MENQKNDSQNLEEQLKKIELETQQKLDEEKQNLEQELSKRKLEVEKLIKEERIKTQQLVQEFKNKKDNSL